MAGGGAIAGVGLGLDATGAGAVIGVPANIAGVAIASGSAAVATSGTQNIVKDASDLISNIRSGSNKEVKSGANGKFENAPYHGKADNGKKNKAPTEGQQALDNSVSVSEGTTTRRIGVSKGEIVVLDETTKGVFHGHVRSIDELTPKMRSALQKAGLINKKGKIINDK
ncbi:hypothetical protein PGRAN_08519 [Listeria grandensis FSL F6-0971]|uniref:Uncharacterized protein n=1 Tax=Listeria grandensis FSL F6-0971 TaxID=1265819 RepID=W7BJL3_9LIST|nr:hypothetical protein [Listeria grandensis]EUJ23391.1 hypothetical protein PGRAN_08519 [Listeria grandensis FSL F6-0971]